MKKLRFRSRRRRDRHQLGKRLSFSFTNLTSGKSCRWSALGIGAAIVGAAIGRYTGSTHPLGGAAAVWAITSRIAEGSTIYVVPAIAEQAGHVIWFLLAFLVLGSDIPQSLWIEELLMTGALLWLFLKPSVMPLVLLTAWQSFALLTNLRPSSMQRSGTAAHKALLVHVVFRTIAICLMITGIMKLRKRAE